MNYLGLDYRVSLLRAAAFHGSAHQAVMVFQVISPRQLSNIIVGRQQIEFLYQSPASFAASNRTEWLEQLKTDAGFSKVAGVEFADGPGEGDAAERRYVMARKKKATTTPSNGISKSDRSSKSRSFF